MKQELKDRIQAATGGGGLDYNKTAFFLIDLDGKQISQHRARSKKEHGELVSLARKKKCHLYYGMVHQDEITKKYVVFYPLIVDFDSVPDTGKSWSKQDIEDAAGSTFKCPYCDYEATSTPGRTLHVKSKHKEKFDEYKKGDG